MGSLKQGLSPGRAGVRKKVAEELGREEGFGAVRSHFSVFAQPILEPPLSHAFPSIAHSLSSQVPFGSPGRTLDTTSSWSTPTSEERVRCSVSCQRLMTSSQTSGLNLLISWPIPSLESNSVRVGAIPSCTEQFSRWRWTDCPLCQVLGDTVYPRDTMTEKTSPVPALMGLVVCWMRQM